MIKIIMNNKKLKVEDYNFLVQVIIPHLIIMVNKIKYINNQELHIHNQELHIHSLQQIIDQIEIILKIIIIQQHHQIHFNQQVINLNQKNQ